MVSSPMKYNPAFLDDADLIRSFVARTSELERILEVLRENTAGSNQHLLIIGPRGIGKTTLVLRTAAEIRAEPALGAQLYPIVFGEETYQVTNPGELWLEALFHLGEQTGEARWQEAYQELLRERDEKRLRGRTLAQLMDFADEQGKRLVLIVENLNMLIGEQFSGDDAWGLRHTLMNEPRLMLVGTATSRFEEVEEYNQALYELFRIFELEPLDDAEAQALWTSAAGQEVPLRQLRPLQILTGGNPRLIRILSEFAARTSFRSLMDDLTRLVDEHTEYFKHHLDSLPPQERKVFVALADLWDPSTARQVAEAARLDVNTTSALLKRLAGRGAVTAPYKRGRAQYYQVAERMYNIYHLMRRRGQAASRVHAVVRFMVSLYRDEELVRTTRSLVDEATRLTLDERREHFLAYEAILTHTREPRLTKQIVEATRDAFEAMSDVPESLQRLIGMSSTPELAGEGKLEGSYSEILLALRVEDIEDTETLLQFAELLSERDDRLHEVESAFRKALQKIPQDASAWQDFGYFLGHRMQRPEEALESFDRALELDSQDPDTWFNRGVELLGLGRSEEALESFDRALELDARDPTAWIGRGVALGGVGRSEEALESFDRALELDAKIATAWFNRGATLRDLGRPTEALESLDRGLELDSGNSSAYFIRGLVYRTLKQFLEAEDDLRRAVALGIQGVSTPTVLVQLLLEDLDRPDEALINAKEGIERLGSSIEVLNSMAWTFFMYGGRKHLNEAEGWARRAVEQAPENGPVRHTLACLLGAQGKWNDALEQAEVFIQDQAMLDAALDEVIDFFIDAAAAGYEKEVLKIIEASGTVETFEPLTVAIRRLTGAQVDVAREILEVAKDVMKRIEARRAEVQEG